MKRLGLACLAAIAMSACGGGDGGGGDDGASASAEFAGPIASNDVARGQEVFAQVCAGCHSDGLGEIAWPAARVRQQVREGSGRMPPIRETRVSADDLEAVLAYLVTTGTAVDEGGGGAEPASTGGEAPMEEGGEAEPAATDAK